MTEIFLSRFSTIARISNIAK